ncbi:hypothetical protein JCM10914A_25160 [Paenibacillus sp. JCM 10914]|uniref:hypothetical protein n=1 Tax=Paenibacillus sp. JCM 10914 TaxID=1236974 RepID=UPI0003CC4CD8|nr:hypothetical protein [Paenibacillus sp. JCM 10914]GAE09004.1 hypothetical protein JCM10914_5345 [Paenibacillus sp. JCM 10914]
MKSTADIQVHFNCHQCETDIRVTFRTQQFTTLQCPRCQYSHSLMKPTIGQEILLDWEKEAAFQKIRADQTEHDKMELMLLVIKVVELLTWRDEGNGQVRAIETLRQWLLLNGVPKALVELLDARGPDGSSPTEHRV